MYDSHIADFCSTLGLSVSARALTRGSTQPACSTWRDNNTRPCCHGAGAALVVLHCPSVRFSAPVRRLWTDLVPCHDPWCSRRQGIEDSVTLFLCHQSLIHTHSGHHTFQIAFVIVWCRGLGCPSHPVAPPTDQQQVNPQFQTGLPRVGVVPGNSEQSHYAAAMTTSSRWC